MKPWEEYKQEPKKNAEQAPWNEYKETARPKTVKIGVEGLPDATKEALGDFNPLSRAAIGAYATLDNAAMRLKQLVNGLSDEDKTAVQVNRAVQQDPAALAGGVTLQALGLGPLGRAKSVLGSVGANTALGGGSAYLAEPELEGENALDRAKMGALVGGGVAGLSSALGGVIPKAPQTQKLLDEGVVPTPGQAAGQTNLLGRMISGAEEKAASIPIVGDVIKGARRRAVEEFNKAALNRGSPGEKITAIGRAGIEQARDKLDDAYRALYGNLQVTPNQQFVQSVYSAKGSTVNPLSRAAEKQFDRIVGRTIFERIKGSRIPGDVAKQMDSDLGKLAKEYERSSPAQEKAIGEALRKVQVEFRAMIRSQAPADAAKKMSEIDRKYANFIRAKTASNAAGATEGVFTPAQYARAVASQGKGSAVPLGQDLADAGKAVLQDRIPNSGSIDRAMLALGLAGPAANEYYGGPAYLSALLAAPLAYSRTGSRFLMGDIPAFSAAARNVAPYAAQAAAAKQSKE